MAASSIRGAARCAFRWSAGSPPRRAALRSSSACSRAALSETPGYAPSPEVSEPTLVRQPQDLGPAAGRFHPERQSASVRIDTGFRVLHLESRELVALGVRHPSALPCRKQHQKEPFGVALTGSWRADADKSRHPRTAISYLSPYLQAEFYRVAWREREGVEPTAPTEGPGPTDLKSAKPTGTHPLPYLPRTRYDSHRRRSGVKTRSLKSIHTIRKGVSKDHPTLYCYDKPAAAAECARRWPSRCGL